MDLSPFTPLVVSAVTPLVLLLFHRDRHRVINGCLVYQWSKGFPWFFLIMGSAIALLIGFLPQSRAVDDPNGRMVVLVISVVSAMAFAYFFRFRVLVNRDSIEIGAFFLRKVNFCDVVSAKYIQGQNSGQIALYTNARKRINVWETINDFGSCAREINARLPDGVSIPSEGRMANYLRGQDSSRA
jgi:hypothetical protein